MLNNKWIHRFHELAKAISLWSKDRSTGVGCIIIDIDRNILSTGYNGFPRGVDDEPDCRHERPNKYTYTAHAEQNAVAQAARNGVRLKDSIAIITHKPCSSCAKSLMQAGVDTILWGNGQVVTKDAQEDASVIQMLSEAGVNFGPI